ncbi:MAG: VRR-NUC domain-containing protein [Spirochaetales bacterium]|nr:VRR-NUC domain-containing protein [Spirochaetales bacterium]
MKKIESEKTLEQSLKRSVESKMHGLCVKLQSDFMTGLPDRMCLLPSGRVFFIELKTTGKKPRKIQQATHEKLRKLGFEVYVIDSTDSMKKLLSGFAAEMQIDNP